jgi:hypothetical protein
MTPIRNGRILEPGRSEEFDAAVIGPFSAQAVHFQHAVPEKNYPAMAG